MNGVRCLVPGSYLVRDETEPIPFGKTAADVSVAVHHYERFGWVCKRCGWESPLRSDCKHIEAAKARS